MINRRGETIIEVMIAVVVVGAALGSAFAISNKSSLRVQANHERYQAQLLANREAEKLRVDYANFLSKGGKRVDYEPKAGGDTLLCYDPACVDINPPQNYNISINPELTAGSVDATVSNQTYRITVSWNSLVNKNNDQVELLYGL